MENTEVQKEERLFSTDTFLPIFVTKGFLGLVHHKVTSQRPPPFWHRSIGMLIIMLVVRFLLGHGLVVNREITFYYGKTLLCLKLQQSF